MFTRVYHCLLTMFNSVYYDYICIPMFTIVYTSLPMFTTV